MGGRDYAFISGQDEAYQLMGYQTRIHGYFTNEDVVDTIDISSIDDYDELIKKSPTGAIYIEIHNPEKSENLTDGEQ